MGDHGTESNRANIKGFRRIHRPIGQQVAVRLGELCMLVVLILHQLVLTVTFVVSLLVTTASILSSEHSK